MVDENTGLGTVCCFDMLDFSFILFSELILSPHQMLDSFANYAQLMHVLNNVDYAAFPSERTKTAY